MLIPLGLAVTGPFAATADDHEFDGGSHLEFVDVSKTPAQSLFVLGKVWGFLKYHHRMVTSGALDWDHELFRILPAVLDASDADARDRVLLRWIAGIGGVGGASSCAPSHGAHLLPEQHWIRDGHLLGPALAASLANVYRHRPCTAVQQYVSTQSGVGNPKFAAESDYPNLAHVDTGYRLLALYRFWNIIQYWFPYRDVIGEDWDGVLREFIPRFAAADTTDAYERELIQLIARVNDTHANLWSSLDARPPYGDCTLPVEIRFVEERALVVDYLKPSTSVHTDLLARKDEDVLRIGDVIVAIDGIAVASLIEEWAPYYAASNVPTRLRDMAITLGDGACGPVHLTIERSGERIGLVVSRVAKSALEIPLWRTHDLDGDAFHRLSDDVAYLSLRNAKKAEAMHYIESSLGARGLVIDIRNYPGEFVVFALGRHLVAAPTTFARFTVADVKNPGAFTWTSAVSLQPKTPRFEGQVVILVDEVTQSQAEYTSMAFRSAPGAIVIGSTTAGADGDVSIIPLPGGLRSMISGIGVFCPDKTPTQRVGIAPDVVVRPTIAGVVEGRDEVLEEALRRILGPQADEQEVRRLARYPAEAKSPPPATSR